MDKRLEQFRLYLERIGQEPTSIKTNFKLVSIILREADTVTYESFDSLMLKKIKQNRKRKYLNEYVNIVHHWGRCFNAPKLAEYPFFKEKRKDLSESYSRAILTDEEIEAFLAVPNPWKPNTTYWKRHEMWNLFWQLMSFHGCRPGEVASLTRTHIDFGRNMMTVFGKTGRRDVPLSFRVYDKLKRYTENQTEGEHLFPPMHKSRKDKMPYISQSGWQEDFNKRIRLLAPQWPDLAKRENLDPYSLRHSAGTRWAEENWSISKIQQAMGHRRLATTEKYLHMSTKGVAEMIDNDRISLAYKKGAEIVQLIVDRLHVDEKRYKQKVFINIQKKDKAGKKYRVDLESLD